MVQVVAPAGRADSLGARFAEVRELSERLARPLGPEDCTVQSMPDVSPTKWHLAHVTWFFETFVLKPHAPDYGTAHPAFEFLFNSYYNSVGEQFPRPRRGLLSRPTLQQVWDYRRAVDEAMTRLLEGGGPSAEVAGLVELGLHHEQQHQELLLMDIKHVLWQNPLFPAYRDDLVCETVPAAVQGWLDRPESILEIGHAGPGFCFDNETPRHRVLLPAHRLASRPVINREYLEFVEAGGYAEPAHWLADGWSTARERNWQAPLYWVRRDGAWHEFTLGGLRPLDLEAPVCHVSYYEADAFAGWKGCRLPAEAEWEVAARDEPIQGNFAETDRLHPASPGGWFGDVWEWTRSPYVAYPGYRPAAGALGEYNGKFMCNQLVLRGGSCASSRAHLRASYRNFFYPHQRWQFAGFRLARDA